MSPELLQAATGCTPQNAALYADALTDACGYYGITTAERMAAFLAQIGHESGGLRYVAELWGPTAAQRTYEGRKSLGNTQPGDGERFKGHGLIQVTGRANHAAARDRLRREFGADVPDFEADPEALMQPRWACLSAADFWRSHGCNELADKGSFEAITRQINGGVNGLADRLARWERAKAALSPMWSENADPGRIPQEWEAPDSTPPDEAPDWTPPPPKENTMPLPAIIAALLPSFIEAIPKLGKVFGSGSAVSERNVKAAELVASTVTTALGAANEQDAVAKLKADPAAVAVAAKAVDAIWFDLTQAGGGGIDGAGKRDAEASARGDILKSPSFWIGLLLLPLVYLLVLSLIGMIGTATWSDDVRAGLAGSLISAIVGGLVGYYFGQTTSRNRAPAP